MSCVSYSLEKNVKTNTQYITKERQHSMEKGSFKDLTYHTRHVRFKRPTTNKIIIYSVASKSSRNSLA